MVSSISSVKTKVKGNPREPTGGNAPTELTGIPVDGVIAGAGDTSNGRAWPFKWLLEGEAFDTVLEEAHIFILLTLVLEGWSHVANHLISCSSVLLSSIHIPKEIRSNSFPCLRLTPTLPLAHIEPEGRIELWEAVLGELLLFYAVLT